MKNYTLILAFILMAAIATAQKFDKTLLPGKWTAMGVKMSGLVISKDDMEGAKKALIEMVKMETPGYEYTEADSPTIKMALNTMFAELGKCVLTFEKNGKVKMHIVSGESVQDMAGTYKWVGDDKIFLDDTGETNEDDTATVVKLSKNRFAFETVTDGTTVQMIFERN